MTQLYFHIEVEHDVLLDEVEDPPAPEALEAESIEFVSGLFKSLVTTHGRRHDGALICSVKVRSLEAARRVIRENLITEDNDQINSGVEYVIVRDFEHH